MFVYQHHLRNLLRPEHYTSDEHHRLELDRLFRPAWHPVGVLTQLPRPGDFLTFDLFGTPALVRNFGGELRAFLNVCPHRHSRLTDKPCGNTERLRCQYHGWEYDKDGHTGKIPDARAFRPWDRENACLRPFRVGTWGQVVFVSLADDGPPLAEFLAPAREHWADGFGPPFRYSMTWHGDFACDWKVVLENALETYHVPELHRTTFKEMIPEPDCEHDLQPHYTFFEGKIRDDWMTRRMNGLVRRLGMPVTQRYRHLLIHPHVQFSRLDVYRMVQAVYPTGPRSCRYWNFMFTLWGTRGGPLRWVQARFLRWVVRLTSMKVFAEDGSIFAAVQRGLTASPFPGVIGTREERIYPFQQFVLRECGLPTPPDPGEG
jgi:phenylpropionate dioxygenase-like ring-hydroxylating dioxygenase large terminal subunit